MEIIRDNMSWIKRYNKDGELLCQSYTQNTNKDGTYILCSRKANLSVDINKIIKDYLGYSINFECCMFCSQHAKIITQELLMYFGSKAVKSGLKKALKAYTGDYFIDYEDLEEFYKKKDYKSSKNKNKRKQINDNGRGDNSGIFLDFDLTLTDKESNFYDKDFKGFGSLEDLWNSVENYEKLLDVLRKLKKEGYILIIVTRSIKDKVERFVNRFFRTTDLEDSEPLFDYVFGSGDSISISSSSKLRELGLKSNEKNIWSVKKGLFIDKYIKDLKLLEYYFIDDSKDNINMCIDLLNDTLCIHKTERDNIIDILNGIYIGEIKPRYKTVETKRSESFDSPPRSIGKQLFFGTPSS